MRRKIIVFISMLICMLMSVTAVNADTSLDTGTLKWSHQITGKYSIQSPVYYNGYVYVAGDKTLYKYDAVSGEQIATADLGAGVGNSVIAPAYGDGKIFIGINGDTDSKVSLAIVDADTLAVKMVPYADQEKGYQTISRVVYDATDKAVYIASTSRVDGGTFAKVTIPADSESEPVVTTLVESELGFYWSGAAITDDYVVFGSRSDGTDEAWTPATGNALVYAYIKGQTDSEGNPLVISAQAEDSGSICSTAVEYRGKFLLVAKTGKVYEAAVSKSDDGEYSLSVEKAFELGARSTCTPLIDGDTAYIGCSTGVAVVNLSNYTVTEVIPTIADVKMVSKCGDKILATYNKKPGGIFDVLNKAECFTPEDEMQQYCISSIAANDDGSMVYYVNDSKNVMAVRWLDKSDIGALLARISTLSAEVADLTSEITDLTAQIAEKDAKIAKLESEKASMQIELDTYKAKDRTTSVSSVSTKSGSITVKWAKSTGASGYRICYTKSGSTAKYVTATGQTTVTKTIKSLTKGKKYTVKVQPYTVINGKTVYGKFSAAKTITVK